MTNRRGGRIFLRPEVKWFEMACRKNALKQYQGEPLLAPLSVDIVFHFSNNKMPDLFNLPKAVCDALNKIVWKDDRQIVKGSLKKINSGEDRIEITIIEL